ncbi:MAG TPA: MATE family efflux transporter [Woeseiaceae bacterium]|nr:MATE family efflux transporter [Woeseiaceae bacterium]
METRPGNVMMHREVRTLLAISMPLVVAYLAEMGMMITDMIIVGRLGSNELAAVGLTADWFYVLLLIGMGTVSIVGVLAAQSLGAGDRKGVTAAVEQGMIAATIMSIPVMLAVWYLGPALKLAKQDADVVRLVTAYSQPLTAGVLPVLWFTVLRNYLSAVAKASAVMLITFAALLLNLALNYTLVYGKFGLPALGVVGAGIGTTIVNWTIFGVLAAHVAFHDRFAAYRPRLVPRAIDVPLLRDIFVLGLPITAAQLLGAGMFTAAAVLIGMLGAVYLAAQQIVYTVIYIALSISLGIGDAVRVRVAYGIGVRSVDAARCSTTIGLCMAAAVTILGSAALWLFPELIVSIFLDTGDVANAGALLLAVNLSVYAGLFQVFDGVLIVMANALRGLRDTRSPMWIMLSGYWLVGIGMGAILCFPLEFGAAGLWWGLILGPVIANVLMTARFRRRIAEAGALIPELDHAVTHPAR